KDREFFYREVTNFILSCTHPYREAPPGRRVSLALDIPYHRGLVVADRDQLLFQRVPRDVVDRQTMAVESSLDTDNTQEAEVIRRPDLDAFVAAACGKYGENGMVRNRVYGKHM